MLLEPIEWRYLRRRHQITQAYMAERIGVTVGRIRQFEAKTYDPRYSTLVKYRNELYAVIAEQEARERAEFDQFLRRIADEPDNIELVRRYRKQRAWERGHRVSWLQSTKAPKTFGGTGPSVGTSN